MSDMALVFGKHVTIRMDMAHNGYVLSWGKWNKLVLTTEWQLMVQTHGLEQTVIELVKPLWLADEKEKANGVSRQSPSATSGGAVGAGPFEGGSAQQQQLCSQSLGGLDQAAGAGAAGYQQQQQQQYSLQQWAAMKQQLLAQRARPFAGSGPVEPPKRLSVEKIILGELVGYRAWRLTADGKHLRSLVQGAIWPPGEPMDAKRVPSGDGEGVYAFSSKRRLLEFLDRESQGRGEMTISGTVRLWGQVVEHELGWRAEYAAVAGLFAGPRSVLASLRDRYGVTG